MFNRRANEYADRELYPNGGSLVRTSRRLAAESHAKCQHPSTCPCHHHVGQILNKQPVR
jgi:hypothetical protein